MNKSNNIILITNEVIQKREPLHFNWLWKKSIRDNIPTLRKELEKKQQKTEKENMIIDITISLPKAPKPKRKVRVFSNFVKVGFNQYTIRIDPFTGYEYVKIDGKRYEVIRDLFNRGVLVEI
jgi:hypothetical protein